MPHTQDFGFSPFSDADDRLREGTIASIRAGRQRTFRPSQFGTGEISGFDSINDRRFGRGDTVIESVRPRPAPPIEEDENAQGDGDDPGGGGFGGNANGLSAFGTIASIAGLGPIGLAATLARGALALFGEDEPAELSGQGIGGQGLSGGIGPDSALSGPANAANTGEEDAAEDPDTGGPGTGGEGTDSDGAGASPGEDSGSGGGPGGGGSGGGGGPGTGGEGTDSDGAGASPGEDSGSGGGGGGDDPGDCVMTTALNDMGDWTDSSKRAAVNWCRKTHHDGSARGRTWINGYHAWGGVMASMMRRSKLLRHTIRPMMNVFTAHATGRKRTVAGFVIKSLIVDPMSYVAGVVFPARKS